jgi:predicted FMN-binding regulatory protein PaiB
MQIDYDFYTYRKRNNSTTTTPEVKKIKDILKVFDAMMAYIDNSNFPQELKLCSYKAASTLIYQATSIYGHLNPIDKNSAKYIIPKRILKFCIKNSIDQHQKIKFLLFTYSRFIVDLVYKAKL